MKHSVFLNLKGRYFMENQNQCIEIVIYRTENLTDSDRQRTGAVQQASELPGFSGWLPLTGCDSLFVRADLVVWDSPESAVSAGKIVSASKEFSGLRESVIDFIGSGYFASPVGGLLLMQQGDGVEIGRFRLREGVTEEMALSAWRSMCESHLSGLSGWRGQRLFRLEDGTFIDLALSGSLSQSQKICGSWAGNEACETFLGLIEPVSMEFGTAL